jgi:hypothetical protein
MSLFTGAVEPCADGQRQKPGRGIGCYPRSGDGKAAGRVFGTEFIYKNAFGSCGAGAVGRRPVQPIRLSMLYPERDSRLIRRLCHEIVVAARVA